MEMKKDAVIRTLLLGIALLNQVLAIFGGEQLPFSQDEMYQFFSLAGTIITSLIAWWKNNSFTPEAKEGDRLMKHLKETKEMR